MVGGNGTVAGMRRSVAYRKSGRAATTMRRANATRSAERKAKTCLAGAGARVGRGLGSGSGKTGRDARRLWVCRGAVLDTEVSEGIKMALLELVEENNAEYRTQINELLYQLESRNPTLYPTTSPLLNGEWEFKYIPGIAPGPVPSPTREIALFMYAGGYTPGKFLFDLSKKLPSSALDISDTRVTIQASQPRGKITATLKVLNNTFPVELRTSIEAESDVRMKESYLDAEAMGRDITIPAQLRTERVFYITYLDENLLISRDESGTPDILYRVPSSSRPEVQEEHVAAEEANEVVEPDAAIKPEESGEGDKDKDDAFNSW
ncbi:hypothetical protein HOP50_07g47880 [Chloropicon primus]|uniref:Plastid lipid-associated protein/fibrillin conserved domain-containing protein n=1 Tax=Chloropicon primus TaxID=1764295 RepID=A0A5B8MNK6_9CHLO|nr:hypothetical protein A3770_07p47660 [Chloropicon primus]UPR01466.1 hypothetical protein HOP50_07g47880 [Chloropicon primus]|eukprot:QDZ22248.1 hypothetical protein A3770_07p47660 [Chloropicon primus]